ncbi:MAG: helix-turn-helix domain-containing protein [Chitinivibrionales bacterium]|nr:helix-turn-helix domain-containing protein [Chitinivibrionales bacterium]
MPNRLFPVCLRPAFLSVALAMNAGATMPGASDSVHAGATFSVTQGRNADCVSVSVKIPPPVTARRKGPPAKLDALPVAAKDRPFVVPMPDWPDSFSFLENYSGAAPIKPSQSHLTSYNNMPPAGRLAPQTAPVGPRVLRFIVLLASIGMIVATVFFYRSRRRNKESFMKQTRLSIMDKEVRRACKYIESNYADPRLDPEFICKELTTGRAFLEALFERELGMKVGDFIDQVRVHHVRRLQEAKAEMDPAGLAGQTGFADIRALQETYLRVTGKSIDLPVVSFK